MKRVSMLLIATAMAIGIATAQPTAVSVENDTNTTAVKQTITMGDVKIIEATENIRLLSQKIAKEYLFYYTNPKNIRMKRAMQVSIKEMSRNIKLIASFSHDKDTADVLEFLNYSSEEILTLLKQKPTVENAELMLDYSDTMLEGADLIGKRHMYDFNKEERMLISAKNLSFFAERAMKFYLALYNRIETHTNRNNLKKSVEALGKELERFYRYSYPKDIETVRSEIRKIWSRTKDYITVSDDFYIAYLLSDALGYMEEDIDRIIAYHTKKL